MKKVLKAMGQNADEFGEGAVRAFDDLPAEFQLRVGKPITPQLSSTAQYRNNNNADRYNAVANDFNQRGEEAAKWAGKEDFYKLTPNAQVALVGKYTKHLEATTPKPSKLDPQKRKEVNARKAELTDRKIARDKASMEAEQRQRAEAEQQAKQKRHDIRKRKEELTDKKIARERSEMEAEAKQAEVDKAERLKKGETLYNTSQRLQSEREMKLRTDIDNELYRTQADPKKHAEDQKKYDEIYGGKAYEKYVKAQENIKKESQSLPRRTINNLSDKGKAIVHNVSEMASGNRRQSRADFATTYNTMLMNSGSTNFIDSRQAAKLQRKYEGMTPEEVFAARQKGMFGGLKDKASEVMDKAGEIASETNFMEYLGQGWDWATQDTQHALMVAGGAVGVGILGAEILDDDDDY